MHVDFLWMPESLRGHGNGTRLMDATEAMAREHGACDATPGKYSFQVPGFFAKRGYSVLARFDDYPPPYETFLSKRLDAKCIKPMDSTTTFIYFWRTD